jgi:hypothetical protein
MREQGNKKHVERKLYRNSELHLHKERWATREIAGDERGRRSCMEKKDDREENLHGEELYEEGELQWREGAYTGGQAT